MKCSGLVILLAIFPQVSFAQTSKEAKPAEVGPDIYKCEGTGFEVEVGLDVDKGQMSLTFKEADKRKRILGSILGSPLTEIFKGIDNGDQATTVSGSFVAFDYSDPKKLSEGNVDFVLTTPAYTSKGGASLAQSYNFVFHHGHAEVKLFVVTNPIRQSQKVIKRDMLPCEYVEGPRQKK